MADLTSERGQIILIAAFALAVTFIALALVVNAAIFTENLASRGSTSGGDDALTLRHEVEQNVGSSIEAANRYNTSSESDLEDAVQDSVGTTGESLTRQQSAGTKFVTVGGPTSYTQGTQIRDNASGGSTFENKTLTTDKNWTVAENIDNTRAFTMTINDPNTAGGANFGADPTEVFRVRIVDGSDEWRMNVTEQSSGPPAVGIEDPSGNQAVCPVSGGTPFEIDLSRGLVDGRPCPGMTFAEGISGSYDIKYNESDLVTGNYSMVVDRDGYSNSDDLQSGVAATDPYTLEGIYAVTVEYRFDGPSLTYRTDVRVAPGEPE